MAHLSGLIDVPDAHPTVRVMPSGTVLLNMDDLGLRFHSVAALAAWLECIDREVVQLGPHSDSEVDEYHAKVRQLRDEKAAL